MMHRLVGAHNQTERLGASWRGESRFPRCAIWQKQRAYRTHGSLLRRLAYHGIPPTSGGLASRPATLMVAFYFAYVLYWIAPLSTLLRVYGFQTMTHNILRELKNTFTMRQSRALPFVKCSPLATTPTKGKAPDRSGASNPWPCVRRRAGYPNYSHDLGYSIAKTRTP